ncbi:MAG: hypothetical protein KBD00_02490 [Candidatus Peribacteraceae bacterium]|nr:hypothetical protein [Candidatus Peribacteraceae bacterium]
MLLRNEHDFYPWIAIDTPDHTVVGGFFYVLTLMSTSYSPFNSLKDIASAITPVPGGVGPMTVASLMRNCVVAKKRQMA